MKDFSNQPTTELVSLLSAHEKNKFLPFPDKKEIVKELFKRNEFDKLPDEVLRSVTLSLLPPMSWGDERLASLQALIATEELIFDIAKNKDKKTGWSGHNNKELIRLFTIFVSYNTEEAIADARQIFVEAFRRGLHTKFLEEPMFAFIRRVFPKETDESFRAIAETILYMVTVS